MPEGLLRRAVWAPLAVVLAAFAIVGTPTASAHPEVCAYDGKEEEPGAGGDGHHDGEICFTAEQIAAFDDSGALLAPGEIGKSKNMHLLANLPKSGPFAPTTAFNSDLAFWGDMAVQGNYEGFQLTDISAPGRPTVLSQVRCPGSQNDVSVYGDLVFTSTDSSRKFAECKVGEEVNPPQSATIKESWEGVRIFDISDRRAPEFVSAVETDCGSHTHTIVPDLGNGRLLLYVSSYGPNATHPDCQPPHDKISIIEVPVKDPAAAKVIAEPVLFPDGGFPGGPNRSATAGCHDITVYPAYDLAAGACMGEGVIMDISKPAEPKVVSTVRDENFAFWHSATFTNDAKTVLFTDELGGGGGPTCNPTVGPTKGADAIYDISNPAQPKFVSYFKIPRTQSNTENCVAHNGNVLPLRNGKDIFVQAWYQGGTSVIDFTDPAKPREVAYFDRGPISETELVLGGSWSSYFYRGKIYANDIQKGLDVLKFSDRLAAGARKQRYLNAQTQEPVG